MADLRKQTPIEPTAPDKPAAAAPARKSLKWHRDHDAQVVRGIFRFHEVPGGLMSFSFKAYKEDKVQRYDLVDGQIASVPLGVARHLNKNLWYPRYSFEKIEGMQDIQKVGQKIRRCSFQSLEFMDDADLTPDGMAVSAMTIEMTAPIE